jgi:hypothetical protein
MLRINLPIFHTLQEKEANLLHPLTGTAFSHVLSTTAHEPSKTYRTLMYVSGIRERSISYLSRDIYYAQRGLSRYSSFPPFKHLDHALKWNTVTSRIFLNFISLNAQYHTE